MSAGKVEFVVVYKTSMLCCLTNIIEVINLLLHFDTAIDMIILVDSRTILALNHLI